MTTTHEPALPPAPETAWDGSRFAFGRYRDPIASPHFPAGLLSRFRLKEWHYLSFVTDRWFLAFGVVQLGYVANMFLYLVDRERPEPAREIEALSPLGYALRFAPSSIEGRTVWRSKIGSIRVRWSGRWYVDLDVTLDGKRLHGDLDVEPSESLALLHPLDPSRPAYTHKAAALPVRGRLDYGTERLAFDGGLGILDWTRSFADRETRWKWASFATRLPDGRTAGLNLSAEVYDDARGDSRENAFWHEGRVRPLGGVRFELPRNPGCEDWRITSREGDEVDLTFRPLGARAQRVDFRLVRSDFIQPYGVFRGTVADVPIDGAFGVVEDHLSVW